MQNNKLYILTLSFDTVKKDFFKDNIIICKAYQSGKQLQNIFPSDLPLLRRGQIDVHCFESHSLYQGKKTVYPHTVFPLNIKGKTDVPVPYDAQLL